MNITNSVNAAFKRIDDLGDPTHMSKSEWVEFLTEIIDGCRSRREAAEEELAADSGGEKP